MEDQKRLFAKYKGTKVRILQVGDKFLGQPENIHEFPAMKIYSWEKAEDGWYHWVEQKK